MDQNKKRIIVYITLGAFISIFVCLVLSLAGIDLLLFIYVLTIVFFIPDWNSPSVLPFYIWVPQIIAWALPGLLLGLLIGILKNKKASK